MLKRILVAIPIIVLVALAIFVQSWVLCIFAIALSLMCQYEIVRALDSHGRPVIKAASYIFALAMAYFFYMNFFLGMSPENSFAISTNVVLAAFIAVVLGCFAAVIFSKKHDISSVFNTIFTMVYPQLFFVLFYIMIRNSFMTGGGAASYYNIMIMLLMVFLPAMFTDTFAYFFGMALGKKKLCPSISPKKTVVGSVAGIAGGVIAAVGIWAVFTYAFPVLAAETLPRFIFTGALLAVVAQIGDLSASLIKRAMDIKDFGKLLPGHGGVVDRMDSILFCIAALFAINSVVGFIYI